jgi:hypothetical protein
VNDRQEATQRAAEAYRALADLAETVEDEWQYVTDLVDAYLPAIGALAGSAGADGAAGAAGAPGVEAGGALTAAQVAAVDELIAEIELITDPHKAIDWLSTFPHVLGLALGGDVDGAGGGAQGGGASAEPDEDSPFRMLRGFR